MHGGGAYSQGEMEETPTVQYTVDYNPKLKQLFEEDSSNESYSLPFKKPKNLMTHFVQLEESNLSLIQQWQENEQQTETKRKEFERIQIEKNLEIHNLQKSVEENKTRRGLIVAEKNTLEMQTAKGNGIFMSDSVFADVVKAISDIRQLVDKKRAKNANQPEPT